jgi:hypothetical protein
MNILKTVWFLQAFTAWKEGDIPAKMVNNALIHFFKQVSSSL